jgi:hypothetical protein
MEEPTAADRARVVELLGREPQGRFEVAVRDADGHPVVLRNAPLLDDGTPMPTRYWLVGPDEVRRVARLEAAGGVRAAERSVDPDRIASAHERYAHERDRALPADHRGPRPAGGVGGTREGVKCLHAHYAWHLAGGDDPVGQWVERRLDGAWIRLDDVDTAIGMGDHWAATVPVGAVQLADELRSGGDPPAPADLTNALGLVEDHLSDLLIEHPDLGIVREALASGPMAETIARVELGHDLTGAETVIDRAALEDVFRTVVTESTDERAHNPGLPDEHVGAVVGAATIMVAVARRLGLVEITVTATHR